MARKRILAAPNEQRVSEIVSEIWQAVLNNFETSELEFLAENLRFENDTRTNSEILKSTIKEIIEEIKEYNDENERLDYASEWADGNTEIHTTRLFEIYAKNPYFSQFAEEARSELGAGESIINDLQGGIFLALQRFALFVIERFNEYEEITEDDEDPDEELNSS